MSTPGGTDILYSSIPVFRGFTSLMDPALYLPLPDDWSVGVADIVESTKAIADQRYKAVNMAGASVIAAVANALDGREFPFVFGGDGASFAVAPDDLARARCAGGECDVGRREPQPRNAGGAGTGPGRACARPRRPRGALRSVSQSVLCDVFRRRPRLGGSGHEARRVRGDASQPRHTAGPVGTLLPFRGNSLHARHHPFRAGGTGQGRRSARIPQGHRGHHRSGRAESRCGTAGADGRS